MTLAEYTTAVEQLERGEIVPAVEFYMTVEHLSEATARALAAEALRREIARVAWQPWVRGEARELCGRLTPLMAV